MPTGSLANATSLSATVQSTGRTTVVSQTFAATPVVSFDSLTDFDQTGLQDGFYIVYDSASNTFKVTQLGNANGAFDKANSSFDHANAAFNVANTGLLPTTIANAAFSKANSNFIFANNSFHHANAAFGAGNTNATNVTTAQNSADASFKHANAAFGAGNTNATNVITAQAKADAAFGAGNTNATSITTNLVFSNNAFHHANAAFTSSNTKLSTSGGSITGDITIAGNIIPNASNTFNLGSESVFWRDLYLSGSTLVLGGTKMETDPVSGGVVFIPKVTAKFPNPKALFISPQGRMVTKQTTAGRLTADQFAQANTDATNDDSLSNEFIKDTANTANAAFLASNNKFLGVGTRSFVGGNSSNASATDSFAFGDITIANSNYAVAFGQNCVSSGLHSFSAGEESQAEARRSVAIGEGNISDGAWSQTFGRQNRTTGDYSHASGIRSGAHSSYAFVHGGFSFANGQYSLVLSSSSSVANNTRSAVIAGDTCTSNGISTLVGGFRSRAKGNYGIAYGYQAVCDENDSFVISSSSKIYDGGNYSFIAGGNTNEIYGDYGFIGGGRNHDIESTSEYSAILGGYQSEISGDRSFIGGGRNHVIGSTAADSAICGGFSHETNSDYNFIAAGYQSVIDVTGAFGSSIIGVYQGKINHNNGDYSILAGGSQNTLQSKRTGIIGGQYKYTYSDAENSGIIGGYGNKINAHETVITGGRNNSANITSSKNIFIGGGADHILNSSNSAIIGGSGSIISSDDQGATVILGGSKARAGYGRGGVYIPGHFVNSSESSYHFTRQHTLLTRTTSANKHDLTLDGSNTVLTSAASGTFNLVHKTIAWPSSFSTVSYFKGVCVAHSDQGDDAKAWEVIGLIKTNQSSGVTTPSFTVTEKFATSGATAWDLEAQKVNSGAITWLRFTVTGETSHDIAWALKIESTEMNHSDTSLPL